MVEGRAAAGAEAEDEASALIACAQVFGAGAEGLIRGGEGGEGREDTAGALLAGEAMADPDAEGRALDGDAAVAADAGGGAGRYRASP
jgi:hypothetical protein